MDVHRDRLGVDSDHIPRGWLAQQAKITAWMNIRTWYLFPLALLCFPLLLHISLAQSDSVGTAVTIVVAPNAPSNFTAVPDSSSQVTLSWTDNSDALEDGFSVERKTGVGGTYAVIATTTTGVATYVDNTVDSGTTYFYRVRAYTGP